MSWEYHSSMSWNSFHPCGTNHAATRSAASSRCCCQVSSDQTMRGWLVPQLWSSSSTLAIAIVLAVHSSSSSFYLRNLSFFWGPVVAFLCVCCCFWICVFLGNLTSFFFPDCGDDWNGSNDELGTCCFPSCLVIQVGVVWKKRKSLWLLWEIARRRRRRRRRRHGREQW
jgi:hypothetical protein